MELARVKQLLHELQIHPNKKLGQNFLISEAVIARICDRVARIQPASVVEVGPGLGSLTEVLLQHSPLLIELDRTLAHYWSTRGCHVLQVDALQLDWAGLSLPGNSCLVSNLPYQISSSIVIDRSLGPPSISHMVLMFQREVAQRIQSSPASKDYGLLSVISQTFWQIERVADAAPGAFFPAPQVASRVLAFAVRPSPIIDKAGYLAFVKAAFALRRKQVGKALLAFARERWRLTESEMLECMDRTGVRATQRAEEITVNQWVELFGHSIDRRK